MRILTLDELYNFCQSNKIHKFSSNETGSQIVVSVPAQFEVTDKYVDDTLLFAKVKLMHSGVNRNHSNVTDEALHKAGNGLAYKPILANFMEYYDEETGETLQDFTSHDMIINEDGTTTYLEKQIGSFTADDPYYEVEESTGHNFLYGYCAIPREYTQAADIIERKNGTKVSVELAINEMQYDSKSKVLDLTDVIILGATCLGKDPETLEDVGEGMLNARLDIEDFSVKKDSIKFDKDERLIELLDKLDTTLSNINIQFSKEGGNSKLEGNVIDELVKFDDEPGDNESTNEETGQETGQENGQETGQETGGDQNGGTQSGENGSGESGNGSESESGSGSGTGSQEGGSGSQENGSGSGTGSQTSGSQEAGSGEQTGEEGESSTGDPVVVADDDEQEAKRKFAINDGKIEFALSINDKICALGDLVNATYASDDNTYYFVTVYDNYVVMEDWWNGKHFKQSYEESNNVFALVGDRVPVYVEYVTDEEMKSLDEMRANYSSIVDELNKYKYAEEFTDKMSVFTDDSYSDYLDTDEFKNIMKKEFVDQYSKEELAEKADAALGKLVKISKKFSFSTKSVDKKISSVVIPVTESTEEKKPYGNLFD